MIYGGENYSISESKSKEPENDNENVNVLENKLEVLDFYKTKKFEVCEFPSGSSSQSQNDGENHEFEPYH